MSAAPRRRQTPTGETPDTMLDRIAQEVAAGQEPPIRLSHHVFFEEDGSRTIVHEVAYWVRCHLCGGPAGQAEVPGTFSICQECTLSHG